MFIKLIFFYFHDRIFLKKISIQDFLASNLNGSYKIFLKNILIKDSHGAQRRHIHALLSFNKYQMLKVVILCYLYFVVFYNMCMSYSIVVQDLKRSPQIYWWDYQGEVSRSLANFGRSPHSATRLLVHWIQGLCSFNWFA